MRLLRSVILLTLTCCAQITAWAQDRVVESETHRFVEVAKGVWHVSGNGKIHTMSNAMVLVGEFDTLIEPVHETGNDQGYHEVNPHHDDHRFHLFSSLQ